MEALAHEHKRLHAAGARLATPAVFLLSTINDAFGKLFGAFCDYRSSLLRYAVLTIDSSNKPQNHES